MAKAVKKEEKKATENKENEKKGSGKTRYLAIDFMRALGVLLMIQVHIAMNLLSKAAKLSPVYTFMNTIAQSAAPLFLTAVGISLVISIKRRKEDAAKHIVKRGLFLIFVGLLFINLWQADILHYIGLYLVAAFFLLKLDKWWRLAAANAFLWCAPLILKYIDYMSGWDRLAYKLAGFWTLSGFFKNLVANGFYPIFPWLFYPIVGTIIGEYFLNAVESRQEEKFVLWNVTAGGILMAAGYLMHLFSPWQITFYPATVSFVVFHLGVCLAAFALFFWLLDVQKLLVPVFRPIVFLGTVAFSIYIMHVVVGLLYFYYTGKYNTFGLGFVIPYIIGMLALIGVWCYGWVRKFGFGPFESLLRKVS